MQPLLATSHVIFKLLSLPRGRFPKDYYALRQLATELTTPTHFNSVPLPFQMLLFNQVMLAFTAYFKHTWWYKIMQTKQNKVISYKILVDS